MMVTMTAVLRPTLRLKQVKYVNENENVICDEPLALLVLGQGLHVGLEHDAQNPGHYLQGMCVRYRYDGQPAETARCIYDGRAPTLVPDGTSPGPLGRIPQSVALAVMRELPRWEDKTEGEGDRGWKKEGTSRPGCG